MIAAEVIFRIHHLPHSDSVEITGSGVLLIVSILAVYVLMMTYGREK